MMKRLLFAFLLLSIPLTVWATNKYAITGGGNWSANSTWNTASNQATSNTTAPTTSDEVILDQYAGQVTIDGTGCVALDLNMTGFVSSMTFVSGKTLTVGVDNGSSTTVTLAGTLGGPGTLKINSNSYLTTNGVRIPGKLQFSGNNRTATITDYTTVSGILDLSLTGAYMSVAGSSITCLGGYECNGAATGTVTITLAGQGIIQGSPAFQFSCPMIVNTTSTYTLSGTPWYIKNTTVTYVAGTLTVTNSNIYMNGNIWLLGPWPNLNSMYIVSGGTLTVDNNLTFSGLSMMFGACVLPATNDLTFNGGLYFPSNGSVKLQRALTISNNRMYVGTDFAVTLYGAYDVTVSTLTLYEGSTLKIPDGRTLTVQNEINTYKTATGNAATLSSNTASTTSNLVYQGLVTNERIFRAAFTDIAATGTPLFNLWGGTLTRTSGIRNITAPADIVGIQ